MRIKGCWRWIVAAAALGSMMSPSGGRGDPRWRGATTAAGLALEDEHDLPPGPIRERHELMEDMGKQAKALNAALKAGDTAGVAAPAEAMAQLAARIVKLFPEGSTNPKSRAKPEIWQKFDRFEALANDLETSTRALAVASKAGFDVQALAAKVMRTCKSCHDTFRKPKKKES